MEVNELFNALESNSIVVVEDIKKKFTEYFSLTKDNWLVNGLVDYYLQTNSLRIVDVLVKIQAPHDKHFFERLLDMIRNQHKMAALTLLGHVVRRQPSWLYKIANHTLFQKILHLLKVEVDIVPLMSALLCLITMLPMMPSLMGPYLQDFFEVFSRLASWKCNNPSKLTEDQLVHLQVGLYALFHRLYGMFPCNFIAYLKREYKENSAVFSHTIKPLLETVRMHPLLVTANQDAEINNVRWKNMEVHDVVVECSRMSLDSIERSQDLNECSTPLNRTYDYTGELDSSVSLQLQQSIKNTSGGETPSALIDILGSQGGAGDFWSPSMLCPASTPPPGPQTPTPNTQTYNTPSATPAIGAVPASLASSLGGTHEGASPPEAAVEATPETTPLKDSRARALPISSNAARALTSKHFALGHSNSSSNTPTQSQPSSPMKKEQSPFRFPSEINSGFEQGSIASQKLSRVILDRSQIQSDTSNLMFRSPLLHPTSPLRVMPLEGSVPSSPIPEPLEGLSMRTRGDRTMLRFESPIANVQESSQEDQEVTDINRRGETMREVQSVFHYEDIIEGFNSMQEDRFDLCDQHHGSPCAEGGLHIPNSRSMLDFARRVKRLRFYSQCVTENTGGYYKGFSAGTSPAETIVPKSTRFRRTNSCPEIKRSRSFTIEPFRVLDEQEELLHQGQGGISPLLEESELNKVHAPTRIFQHISTQTVSVWPQPYEHLFVGLLSCGDAKHPAGQVSQSELHMAYQKPLSPYAMLDRYITSAVQRKSTGNEKTEDRKMLQNMPAEKRNSLEESAEVRSLREQLELVHLQLQFERHRREVHAERNRRLLGKSRDNRAIEEQNTELHKQVLMLQKDIEALNAQLEKKRKHYFTKEAELQEMNQYWQDKSCDAIDENCKLRTSAELLQVQLTELTQKHATVVEELQDARAMLFDVGHEMKQALLQAEVGEQFRSELQNMQTQLVLMGELQCRYRDRLSELPWLRARDQELENLHAVYNEELTSMSMALDSKTSALDAAKARIAELESTLTRRDVMFTDQKRLLKVVKEEYQEQLAAVESKYKAQRSINQRMEEQLLELYRNESRLAMSPDSGSVLSGVSGVGDRTDRTLSGSIERVVSGSPLSASLASSDGLNASLLTSHIDEIKNLQVIVDLPEDYGSNMHLDSDPLPGPSNRV